MPNTPSLSNFARFATQSAIPFKNPALVAGDMQVAAMNHLMGGAATFYALQKAVNDLVGSAPKDHDIIIHAFNISVEEVFFLKPHTMLFRGFDQEGNHTSVVVHYSQMVAHVVYRPKTGPKRIITGFSTVDEK